MLLSALQPIPLTDKHTACCPLERSHARCRPFPFWCFSPRSLRRLLCDVGSLLDVRPLLAQPVNGLCPVVGAAVVPPSSGCSKNTW